jgi:hypothetical protein
MPNAMHTVSGVGGLSRRYPDIEHFGIGSAIHGNSKAVFPGRSLLAIVSTPPSME